MKIINEIVSVKLHKWFEKTKFDFMEEYEIGGLVPCNISDLEKYEF